MGWWGGYAGGMGVGMVLFWGGLIIVGIVALIRYTTGSSQAPRGDAPTAEQLLAARFASGEIDETQYRERLAILREAVRR